MSIIKVDIPRPKSVQIEIWDKVYDIVMGESFIVDRWLELSVRAEEYLKNTKASKKGETNAQRLRSLFNDSHSFIDDMLGAGAALELFGRNPVGIADMVQMIATIVTAATKGYSENLESYA